MRLIITILGVITLSFTVHASTAKVSHVSDGDSFTIASGERVRMIGLNAPELADPFGAESKEHLSRLIRGKTIRLESDPQNDDRDVHGRLLRFVDLNGTDINRQMIADGFAYAFLRYPFASERREAYREAERTAKGARVGIWATAPNARSTSAVPSVTPFAEDRPDESGHDSYVSQNLPWIVLGVILIGALLFGFRFARR